MNKVKFISQQLDYCTEQASKTLSELLPTAMIPRNIGPLEKKWNVVNYEDWTSGFWPGILWLLYEYTTDEKWLNAATSYSALLSPLSQRAAHDHDLGFQIFNSIGHGFRLTQKETYKKILLQTAERLFELYSPVVGTILSWPNMVEKMNWPHNTIIDNMINLELLFWSSRQSNDNKFYEAAIKHADTTMDNHFRDDYTSYHVVVYDKHSGDKQKGVTHQGYADESLWARGQSWAIYGYTMVFRETSEIRFLDLAEKVTDVYLERLPKDRVPYWDFSVPNIIKEPRDASAAAVTASALLELSTYLHNNEKALYYRSQAEEMIQRLSSKDYQSRSQNSSFLLHSTGHYPNGTEIDYSIIYADYYYLEALLRLSKLQAGQQIGNANLIQRSNDN